MSNKLGLKEYLLGEAVVCRHWNKLCVDCPPHGRIRRIVHNWSFLLLTAGFVIGFYCGILYLILQYLT